MIVVKIQGGLGNQMFQYAFARAIQETYRNQKLILDISDYKYDKLRSYSLGHFVLNDNVEISDSGKYNWIYDQRVNPFIKIATKLFPNFQFNIMKEFGIYIWDYAEFKPTQVGNRKNIYIHGYWQSKKYFENIADIISREFSVKEEVLDLNREILSFIQSTNSVCVHIRRGDFLLNTNKLAVCSNEYYLNGFCKIEEIVEKPKYYIFSDDIEFVENKFDFGNREVIFVKNRNKDYEELRLMSNCKHFIIANSTFSWWAAIISKFTDKVVIAPETWYTDGRPSSDLLDKSWKIVKNV